MSAEVKTDLSFGPFLPGFGRFNSEQPTELAMQFSQCFRTKHVYASINLKVVRANRYKRLVPHKATRVYLAL